MLSDKQKKYAVPVIFGLACAAGGAGLNELSHLAQGPERDPSQMTVHLQTIGRDAYVFVGNESADHTKIDGQIVSLPKDQLPLVALAVEDARALCNDTDVATNDGKPRSCPELRAAMEEAISHSPNPASDLADWKKPLLLQTIASVFNPSANEVTVITDADTAPPSAEAPDNTQRGGDATASPYLGDDEDGESASVGEDPSLQKIPGDASMWLQKPGSLQM